ncbi:MAG TPA: ATP-binding protein [Thermoanaerobaculia bacterium]|nr:ATP-binding protein [Thermoanaerobaculia bacterium]
MPKESRVEPESVAAHSELQLGVSSEEGDRRKRAYLRHVNVSVIPRLRLIGCAFVAVAALIHNLFVLGSFSPTGWLRLVAVIAIYVVASTLILRWLFEPASRFDLGFFFLNADLILWAYILRETGGDQSWLFPMMLIRVADQIPTTFRRAIILTHMSVLAYGGMILWVTLIDGRTVDVPSAIAKCALIYSACVYLSLVARQVERRRDRFQEAVLLARTLIHRLENQSARLEIEKTRAEDAVRKSAELERSLAQAQKLDSLGRMATGIAHDFNNTMMLALPWAEVLRRHLPDDAVVARASAQIRASVMRAREGTRRLLEFAQPREPNVTTLDLAAFLDDQIRTIRPSIPESIIVKIERGAEDCFVTGDAGLLSPAVINLVLNARDAMPEGGVLSFETRLLTQAEAIRWQKERDQWVVLAIRDSGCGMTRDVLARIYDPFFSTKPINQGSGLGLSVVYQTVARHGGSIHVDSTPGSGTSFQLLLPRSMQRPAAMQQQGSRLQAEGLSILIIDDEVSVAEGLAMFFESAGASVKVASSGREALAMLDEGLRPDAIILDLGMPEMSGDEVHGEIRRRLEDVLIVLSTGYGGHERIRALIEDGRTIFRQKPYEAGELLRDLRTRLHDGRRSTG